jgi:hypothetical protein
MRILQARYDRYVAVAVYEAIDFVVVSQSKLRSGCPRDYPLIHGLGDTTIMIDPNAREIIQIENARCQLRSDKPEQSDPRVLQDVLAHIIGVLGAKLRALGVNYHYHFRLDGHAFRTVQSLLQDQGAPASRLVKGELSGGGVRLIYDRPDGRHDVRLEAVAPNRPQNELSCHLNIHHDTSELGNLMGRSEQERAYLMKTVEGLCASLPGGG